MQLNDVLQKFGGISVEKLEKKLGLSRQSVYYWKQKDIPKLRIYEIKELLENDSKTRDTSTV